MRVMIFLALPAMTIATIAACAPRQSVEAAACLLRGDPPPAAIAAGASADSVAVLEGGGAWPGPSWSGDVLICPRINRASGALEEVWLISPPSRDPYREGWAPVAVWVDGARVWTAE